MAININNTLSTRPANITDRHESATSKQQSETVDSKHSSIADSVTLSEAAREMDSATRPEYTRTQFDRQRVHELRTLINTGSYEVNTLSIAEKLQNPDFSF